ncbi:MAG: sulfatase-like hydrolase/transferase, partial [Kiritimatiellae bacterium]|nr:sulfatase-like hydrolase/transferase [Kiritimatiellia bacterium]
SGPSNPTPLTWTGGCSGSGYLLNFDPTSHPSASSVPLPLDVDKGAALEPERMKDGERPNILLITTDQQRYDTIAAAGNSWIMTPNLNWLVDGGVLFTNAYSDCPICMPARATIMTGRHGFKMGLTGNRPEIRPMRRETTVAGLLTAAGYQTRAQGKMHFSPLRCHYGFEQMEILEDYYRYMARHPEKGIPMDHGLAQNTMEPGISTVEESHSLTHWTVERSVDFLETRDDTRPFFLWVSFAKPHPPWDPCRNYWELYQGRTVPPPIFGDWSKRIGDVPPGFLVPTFSVNMAHRFSGELLQAARRAYYACITQIDFNLGLLFARLRELDLLENTLIVFTSDHGEMLGDHHMGAKSVPFEGSSRIPMILRIPESHRSFRAYHRGLVCNALVCLADILPTLLNFAGVSLPNSIETDGLDLLAVAEGCTTRAILFGECASFHFVREGSFKYCYETLGGAELLFDLANDPLEQHDLAREDQHKEIRDTLRSKLIHRLQATGHPAVVDGRLVCRNPHLTLADLEKNTWPGYHSKVVPTDVLH